ncbi:MAG: oxygenase MpaB family protein [Myxococcales bacterium]
MTGPSERQLPLVLFSALTLIALLSGTTGAGLFLGSGHTDYFFAWSFDSPVTSATLGAGYLAGSTLLFVSSRSGRWADARLALAATLVQLAAMAVATFTRTSSLASLGDGPIAALVALGWMVFHGLAPLGLSVGAWMATRGPGEVAPRQQGLPRWTFMGLFVPGVAAGCAGLALLLGVDFLPWPTWELDAPAVGTWLLALGALSVGAVAEHDLGRLRGAVWASLVLGLLLAINVVRFPELGWAYALVAGFLLLIGMGGLALDFALPSATAWADRVRAVGGPRRGSARVTPMVDAGFFGPGSVAWRVWSYPTSLSVGFQRAVVIEELDPFLVASVDATKKIRVQPKARYDQTIKYFATVVLGDSRTAVKASEVLMKVHSRMVGIEPISGKPYDANAPASQLWIHLTAWHSILYVYEKYGPGRLSAADELRYWEDCATAAQLQTCDPNDVPRTREGLRAYFASVRPGLVGSTVAAQTMEHLLNSKAAFPGWLTRLTPVAWVVNTVLRRAVIGTMPRWQRNMVGLRQGAWLDSALIPVMRVSFGLVSRLPWLEEILLRAIAPSAVKLALPVLYGVPAQSPEVLTPAAAFARHGVARPAEIYAGYRSAEHEAG